MSESILENDLYNTAKDVAHWHLFSDKTSDPKPAKMSIEEAEAIIWRHEMANKT